MFDWPGCTHVAELELAADGPAAPPRANGELVFEAPWQSRVFGLAAAMIEGGHFSWVDFQAALIAEIATADAAGVDDYWGSWRDALLSCCETSGAVTGAEWQSRTEQLLTRPTGHDHRH